MADVNSDIGLLAGYLIASVPFLAGGVAKGAMAISHHATSYLNPSQNAAEEAAREASTGNVSLGNTSFENSSVLIAPRTAKAVGTCQRPIVQRQAKNAAASITGTSNNVALSGPMRGATTSTRIVPRTKPSANSARK